MSDISPEAAANREQNRDSRGRFGAGPANEASVELDTSSLSGPDRGYRESLEATKALQDTVREKWPTARALHVDSYEDGSYPSRVVDGEGNVLADEDELRDQDGLRAGVEEALASPYGTEDWSPVGEVEEGAAFDEGTYALDVPERPKQIWYSATGVAVDTSRVDEEVLESMHEAREGGADPDREGARLGAGTETQSAFHLGYRPTRAD